MNQKNLKNNDDTVRQTIELLQRADKILGFLIEEKIPELIKASSTQAHWETIECQKL